MGLEKDWWTSVFNHNKEGCCFWGLAPPRCLHSQWRMHPKLWVSKKWFEVLKHMQEWRRTRVQQQGYYIIEDDLCEDVLCVKKKNNLKIFLVTMNEQNNNNLIYLAPTLNIFHLLYTNIDFSICWIKYRPRNISLA